MNKDGASLIQNNQGSVSAAAAGSISNNGNGNNPSASQAAAVSSSGAPAGQLFGQQVNLNNQNVR